MPTLMVEGEEDLPVSFRAPPAPYAKQVRSPRAFFNELGDTKGDADPVSVAAQLMQGMSKPFKHTGGRNITKWGCRS